MLKSGQITLLTALLGFSGFAAASTLGLSVGAGIWQPTPSGSVKKTGDPQAVNVEDELYWSKESQNYFYVTLEHPIPILPNFRLMQTNIDQSGSGPTSFTFNGQTFTGTVTNSASVKQTDLVMYYEVLDDTLMLNLDLGLDIKRLEVNYNISDSFGDSSSDSSSATLPLLYGMFGITPLKGLYLGVEGSYISYSGNTVSDFFAKVSYTTKWHVGVEAGYRAQSVDLEDLNDTTGKLDFKGPYAGINVTF
ncbi:MAG: TIGR04219 family outer membrane beta-barrel protein [Proteobacteria bacterium]|jgi:outer membrane protein|nr:TIGR04219 family outer membrane beta-barrel protein [Pseudomonadota bacterium]MCG6935079.1 TIGR04219 family outer membrane beta-barrel protein [Pseudomonadota bacterium]